MRCELSSIPTSSARYRGSTSIRAATPSPGIILRSRQGDRTNPMGETMSGRSARQDDPSGMRRGCLLTESRLPTRNDLGDDPGDGPPPPSSQALERTRVPEAGCAGHPAHVAVLLEVAVRHVVAHREVAVVAEREVVRRHVSAERAPLVRVPGVEDPPVRDVAESPGLDPLDEPGQVALEAVPQEVAGVQIAVPRHEGRSIPVSYTNLTLPTNR